MLKEVTIESCPFCGGTQFVEGKQGAQGNIGTTKGFFRGSQPLYHIICRDCGSVVRSYVYYPHDLTPLGEE